MLDFETRMLSGEPFTMEELKRAFSKNENERAKSSVGCANFTTSVMSSYSATNCG